MKVLWWLALAITIRADFSLLPLDSRNAGPSVSILVCEFGFGVAWCIVLFNIPDRFISVTLVLSLRGSRFVSMFSSRRLVSDVVGSGCVIWLSGVDKCSEIVKGWLCSYNG